MASASPDCTGSDVATNSPRSSATSATCAPTPRTVSGNAGAVAAAPNDTHNVPLVSIAATGAARAARAPPRSPATVQKRSGSPADGAHTLAANQSTPGTSSQLAAIPGKAKPRAG